MVMPSVPHNSGFPVERFTSEAIHVRLFPWEATNHALRERHRRIGRVALLFSGSAYVTSTHHTNTLLMVAMPAGASEPSVSLGKSPSSWSESFCGVAPTMAYTP